MYFTFIYIYFINVILCMDMTIAKNTIVLIDVCSTKHHPVYFF